MNKAKKSTKRVVLINDIINEIISHEKFNLNIKRNSPESEIQKDVFQRLEHISLKSIVQSYLQCTDKHAQKLVTQNFKWEKDKSTTLKNFNRFGKNYRPDATIEIDNISIAIEIKKDNLKEGLGQSLLYSSVYDFVILIFVDHTVNFDIKNSITAKSEKEIIDKLWDFHNIKIEVV